MNRTLWILTLAACMAQTGGPVVVLLGGIVGAEMAPSPGLATLPVAFMIIGTATSTVPASLLMRRFGRRQGFLWASGYAALGGVLAASAIALQSFWVFCLATAVIGSHNAFVQQYRFAVAESVTQAQTGRALATLMLAGVVAAFLGPKIATSFQSAVADALYAGSFVGLSVLMIGAMLVLTRYRSSSVEQAAVSKGGRALREIILQPNFKLALVASAAAWSVMSLLMTATPVAMHRIDAFDLGDTAWVIQSHIMAMYLPSLVSGRLVDRFGALRIIVVGTCLLMVCLFVAIAGRGLMHYWWALVLLGVGWNFLYLGGTSLLTTTYQPNEQFKVQACNDFVVFGFQAIAALSSGYVLLTWGWDVLVYASALILLGLIGLLTQHWVDLGRLRGAAVSER